MIRRIVFVVALIAAAPTAGWAQGAKPAAKKPAPFDITAFLKEQLVILTSGATAEHETDAKQVAAPSASAASDGAVDAPSFAKVIGLAIDNDLVGVKDGAFTASLTPFAFKSLAHPEILNDADLYSSNANSILRRIGGSVTIGGKGEKFDRDGDGKADDPKTAEDLTDIVTSELRYRFLGVRDRDDTRTLTRYLKFKDGERTVDEVMTAMTGDIVTMRAAEWFKPINDLRRDCGDGASKCFFDDSKEAIAAILKTRHDAGDLKKFEDDLAAAVKLHNGSIKNIDRSQEWTVVGGFTKQGADFGPNRRHVGLRGLFPVGATDHTLNLDWTQAQSRVSGVPDATTVKAGYQIAKTFQVTGVKFSYSATWERYQHVVGAKHDRIAKTGVKFEIPVSDTITIPLSVTWANHRDLLTDQSVLKGHVGLAWDFSGLTKQKDKK